MANTNPEIMKRYKSAVINGMSFKQLVKIYTENNIIFEKDIGRLLLFKHSDLEVELKNNSDQKIELKNNSDQEIELKNNSDQEIELKNNSDQKIELKNNSDQKIELKNNSDLIHEKYYNSIIKKYPHIKQNSILYTILNTNIKPNNDKTKYISLFESMKQFFLNLR
jgi:hypothetical protein